MGTLRTIGVRISFPFSPVTLIPSQTVFGYKFYFLNLKVLSLDLFIVLQF